MAESSIQITDESAFKSGSLGMQILFTIVTFGIYSLYWMHKLHKSIAKGTDRNVSAGLRTIGLFIPFYNFVVLWRDSHDVEPITGKDGVLVFLLFIVFGPAAWYLIQSGINSMHDA